MVFALGGGRKRAGRRDNPRARHARQSRKDRAASSSRLPRPSLFLFPRALPRAFAFATVGVRGVPHALCRMRMRFAAASINNHRSPTIQNSAAGAPFRIPASGLILRRRPTRALSRLHGSMGACGSLPCETQTTGRLTRACSGRRLRRFGLAERKKNRLGPNLAQAPPPSQPTLRGSAPRRR